MRKVIVVLTSAMAVVFLLGMQTCGLELLEFSNPTISRNYFLTKGENDRMEYYQFKYGVTNTQGATEISVATLSAMTDPEPIPESPPWWTEAEFDLLCRVVMAEMGSNSAPDEAQQGVAAVVINRVNHSAFKNTIYDVIYTTGQYACTGYLHKMEPTDRVRANVLIALEGNSGFPEDVVWQAGFPQAAWGKTVDIYKIFYTSPHTTYFCRFGK